MISVNVNSLWSSLIIEELVRQGVRLFVISSGSRNSPLVVAAAEHEKAETLVHFDERGAAFLAQGYGQATGRPAVVIATSGTAAANYFPAVAEASRACVPLLLFTADRPVELRDTGAHQTINQIDLYGGKARWWFDLPAPTTEIDPGFVLTTIDQAVYRATRSPAGPVQINCPFREPLAPETSNDDFSQYLARLQAWMQGSKPYTLYTHDPGINSHPELEELFSLLRQAQKPLAVVGPLHPHQPKENLSALFQRTPVPVLVDIASGLRFGFPCRNRIVHYEYLLRASHFLSHMKPDLILHFGGVPRSKVLNRYLADSGATYILVQNSPFRQDPFHRVDYRIELEPGQFCHLLLERDVPLTSKLGQAFQRGEEIASRAFAEWSERASNLSELSVARAVLHHLPSGYGLFLANSMPIRDADGCGITRDDDILVGVNAGVNGIDGTIASAVGFAIGTRRPTILMLGDLAFLHDLNSLHLVRKASLPVILVVMNNNGGGIFSFLPIARHPKYFEEFFATPHNLHFRHAAELFELDYHKPETFEAFLSVFQTAVISGRSTLIEIGTDRQRNFELHQKLWEHISQAVDREFA